MDKKTITKAAFILLLLIGTCWAGGCTKNLAGKSHEETKPDPVDTILKQLNQQTQKLKTYHCRIEYLSRQPLFESQSLRKGVLYYAKYDEKSNLRINFNTLKQDDDKEQQYIEQYILDGIWLTHIDYQIKEVRTHRLAEPNESKDAFDLVRENFPIIGFSQTEDLKKEFEIKLVEQTQSESAQFIQLRLKVKPDSIYKDDYTSIDFWIDKKLYLPAKIVATSTEPDDATSIEKDSEQVRLLKPRVNEKIDKKVFEIKIPKGFTVEKVPLKKKNK